MGPRAHANGERRRHLQMIDIHSHIWEDSHYSEAAKREYRAAYGELAQFHCPPEEHWEQVAEKVERAAVFAMMMRPTGLVVPNEYVSEYVNRHPDKLVGVASVDPTARDCVAVLENAVKQLGLRGVKLSGAYQSFNPAETRYDPIYVKAQELGIPIFWHVSTTFYAVSPLRWSKPGLIDQVAQRFPGLHMVLCHLGHPWITDAVMVMRKHRNVYGDISGFGFRRWRFYEALATAVEYDVGHKLLFGSDYPICTVEASIEYLRDAADMAKRAGLPAIPESTVEDMLHRDSLKILGMD